MISVRAFAPLMKQRVSIARKTGAYDDFGQPSYAAAVTYQCAVVGEMRKVVKASGEEVPSRQQIILMSNAHVTPEDRVTLSTSDVGSTESYALQPEILAVSRYPFVNGQFVTELWCK